MNRMPLFVPAFLVVAVLSLGAAAPVTDQLTVTGTLRTGVMAPGGETTGIELVQGAARYELDIKEAPLMKKASDFNGKQVTVTGTLVLKQGVETGQRRIITVQSMELAAPAVIGPATTKP